MLWFYGAQIIKIDVLGNNGCVCAARGFKIVLLLYIQFKAHQRITETKVDQQRLSVDTFSNGIYSNRFTI